MALTYKSAGRVVAGNEKARVIDFTADATYAAGGYALATADIESIAEPGQTVNTILFLDSETNVGGYSVTLDRPNSKLLFFLGGTQATTTISSTVVRARVTYGVANK